MSAGSIAGEFITNMIAPDSLLEAFDQVVSFLSFAELMFQYGSIVFLFVVYIAMMYYMGKLPILLYTWYREYRDVIKEIKRIFKIDIF